MDAEAEPAAKKKPKRKSPTQRTLALCRANGWTAGVVERWNPHARIRQDLFGFVDLIVIDGTSILALQATVGSSVASRQHKIEAEPRALEWLRSGGLLQVWGWRQVGARGAPKTWAVRRAAADLAGDGIRWTELEDVEREGE